MIRSMIFFSPSVTGSVGSKDTLKSQNQEKVWVCRCEPIIESSILLEGNRKAVQSDEGCTSIEVRMRQKAGKKAKWSDQRLMDAEPKGQVDNAD